MVDTIAPLSSGTGAAQPPPGGRPASCRQGPAQRGLHGGQAV